MKTEMSIARIELDEKRRYGLILRAVELGLRKVGIKSVSFSQIRSEGDRLSFDVDRTARK